MGRLESRRGISLLSPLPRTHTLPPTRPLNSVPVSPLTDVDTARAAGLELEPEVTTTGVVSWPHPTGEGAPFTITITAANPYGADTKSFLLYQFPRQCEDEEVTETGSVSVTAVFPDAFYVESQDRVWGIRVMQAGSGVTVLSTPDFRLSTFDFRLPLFALRSPLPTFDFRLLTFDFLSSLFALHSRLSTFDF